MESLRGMGERIANASQRCRGDAGVHFIRWKVAAAFIRRPIGLHGGEHRLLLHGGAGLVSLKQFGMHLFGNFASVEREAL
jgi:hypothetical protein